MNINDAMEILDDADLNNLTKTEMDALLFVLHLVSNFLYEAE